MQNATLLHFLVLLGSLGISVMLTPAMVFIANQLRTTAPANSDVRTHDTDVPLLGGIAIMAGFLLALMVVSLSNSSEFTEVSIYLTSLSLLTALGLRKDLRQEAFSPIIQAIVQTIACGIAFFAVFPEQAANSALLTVTWILAGVALINSINFLDVMDGLAGSVTVLIAVFIAMLASTTGDMPVLIAALALSGSILGFLVWNKPKAKVFMGDIGSFGLGFTLYCLVLLLWRGGASVSPLVMILIVPFLDLFLTIVSRLWARRAPWRGDALHPSLQLLNAGAGPWHVIALYAMLTIVSGIAAIGLALTSIVS